MTADADDVARTLETVGPRLRRIRDQRGLTLTEAASATGMSKSTLSRLENGQRRPSLELLRIGLKETGTPYADVVTAVCATLPGPSPADRAAVQAMVDGPPTETVGLEPYDPRLLPLAGGG